MENALKYVHDREHDKGGFTLYKGLPDGKNTYYGLKTLKLFNKEPFNKIKTIKWIMDLQRKKMYGIHGIFYIINILHMFNEKIKVPQFYISNLKFKTDFPNLESAYYHTIISKILKLDNLQLIAEWILSQQNEDGAFGPGRSDIISTYYAIESINHINPSLIRFRNSLGEFIHQCQSTIGGFTFIPDIYPPYLEPTYAGIKIQEIMGINPTNKINTAKFVLNLQNNNGGFRRSKYIGISELEYTFKALYILKSLSCL